MGAPGRTARRLSAALAAFLLLTLAAALAPQAAQAQQSCAPLVAPTISVAAAGPGQLTVTWTLSSYQENVDNWNLQYRKTGGSWTTVPISNAAARSHTITGLEAGTAYQVQLRAILQATLCPPGPRSTTATATTSGTAGTPVLTAKAGDGQVTLFYYHTGGSIPSNNAWSYKIIGTTVNQTFLSSLGKTSGSYTVTSLQNGRAYTFEVEYVGSGGIQTSNQVTVTPNPPPPPVLISDPDKRVTAGTGGTVVVCYNLLSVSYDGTTYLEKRSGRTAVPAHSALKDTTNGVSITEAPAVISAQVLGTGNINFDPCATVGPGTHTVTWEWNGPDGTASKGTTSTTFTVVEAPSTKTLTLSATSTRITEGNSGHTDVTVTITLGEPAPEDFTALISAAGDPGTATEPTKSQDACEPPLQPADTDWCFLLDSAAVAIAEGETEETVKIRILGDTRDESDETIILHVSSEEPGWTRDATLTLTIVDDDGGTAPAAPTGFSAAAGNAQVTLTWDDPDDASITGYKVRYGKKTARRNAKWATIDGSDDETTTHMVTGLDNNAEYSFKVRAVSSAGDGTATDWVDATPVAAATAGVTVTPTTLTVTEGSSATYTVKLNTEPSDSVTVSVGGESGGVTANPKSLVFTTQNYNTAKTVTVSAAADENTTNETATLTHSATGGGYNSVSINSVQVTVTDTTPTLQLSTDPSAVTEGTPISLTVTSDRTLTGTLPVSLTLAARSSNGFTAADIPGTLGPNTFNADFGSSPGGTTGTVSIPTSRDTDATEGAEAYRITLNDAAGYAVGTDVTADGVLNDAAAAISLSIADASAAEGDGTMSFTVTASSAPSSAVTFKYTVTAESGDTATAGSDFTAVTAAAKGSGTIAANAQTTTISVTLTDDNTAESDETFTVTLSEPSGATISDAVATGTITDNDTVAPVETVEPVVIEALKSAANLTLTPGTDRLTLDWSAPADGNRAGWEMRYGKTTGVWSDWRLIGGADTSRHILTGLQAGTEYQVALRPTDARSGQGSGYSVIATGTTTANPPAKLPAKPVNLTATAGNGQVLLAWDAADDDSITGWQWQQARGSAAWGDWTAMAGATAATTSHPVTNLVNGTEYRFRIRAQSSGGAGPASDVVRATPLDARVSVPLALTVTEGVDNTVTVPITTTVAFGQPMRFDIRYGGTATGAADPANGDYDNDAVTSVTFPASETSRNIVIPLTDDGLDEAAETIEVTITPAAGSTLPTGFSIDNATTTVTITDDDASPVLAALDDVSLTLGETLDLTAQATDADDDPIRYVWSRAEGETTPAIPDATDLTTARLTFAPPAAGVYTMTVTADDGNGNTDSKQLTITVQIAAPAQPTNFAAEAGIGQVTLTWDAADDDSITGYQLRYGKTDERESAAWVTLSSTGANTTHTVTGLDNGAEYSFALRAVNAGGEGTATDWVTALPLAPGVTLSASALTIEEGSSEQYTVMLEVKPTGEVTLTVGGAAGNVSVAPARLVFTAMNWATPQSVTVRVAEYADQFMDPAVTLTHKASGGGYDGAVIGNVRVTVTENPNAQREIIRRANEINSDVLPQVIQALGSVSAVKMRMNLGGFGTPPVASANAGPFSAGGGGLGGGGLGGMVGQGAQGSMAESMMGLTGSPAGYGTGLAAAGGRFDATAPGAALRTAGFGAAQYPGTGAGTGMGGMGMSTGMGVGTGMANGPQHPGMNRGTGAGMANRSSPQQRPGSKLSELFNGASFLMPLGEAGSASETGSEADSDSPFSGAAIWGRAEKVSFSGSENATRWDGGLWSANLGADFRLRPNLLVGAALSYARSDADTTTTNTTTNTNTNTNTGTAPADGSQSVHETELTSLSPYAAWLLDDGSSLWASAGYGTGEVRIGVGETALRSANLKVMNGAAGGNWFVSENSQWIAGGVTRLAIKGEAEFFHARSGAEDDLARLLVDTSRLRLALEGSHERRLADGSTLTPAIEAGLRYDGGDVVAGAGLEVGASLIWRNPASGFLLEFRGRHLVTHARDRDEWGVSAMLRLDPAADGLGNFLTLSPSWGGAQTGIAQLFDAQPPAAFTPGSALRPAGRLEAEYGYGFGLDRAGELAVLSPYTRLTMGAQGDRAFQFGMRYRRDSAASLEIEIGHRQPAAMLPAEPSLLLRGEYRW